MNVQSPTQKWTIIINTNFFFIQLTIISIANRVCICNRCHNCKRWSLTTWSNVTWTMSLSHSSGVQSKLGPEKNSYGKLSSRSTTYCLRAFGHSLSFWPTRSTNTRSFSFEWCVSVYRNCLLIEIGEVFYLQWRLLAPIMCYTDVVSFSAYILTSVNLYGELL